MESKRESKSKRVMGDRKLLSGDTVTIRVHISVYKLLLEENQNLESLSETLERLLSSKRD